MSDLKIHRALTSENSWFVVMDEGSIVFRATKPGHTKASQVECEKWIEARSKNLDYYRSSADRVDEVSDWIEKQKGTIPRTSPVSAINKQTRWR